MAFTPKSWKDNEEGGTPLSAAAIIDLEERLAGYTDSQVSGAADDLSAHEAATTDVHGIADTSDLIMEGDARLSDARTPVPHSHSQSDITGLDEALSAKAAAGDLDAHENATTGVHGITDTSDLIVEGDPRLTDARQPMEHSHAQSDVTGLGAALDAKADASAFTAHASATTDVHGISDTSDIIMEGDARLSNARTPVPHASSHAAGQPDAITPAAIGAVPLADLGVVVVRDHEAARPAAGLVLWVVDEEPVNAIAGDQVIGWEPA